MLAWRHGHTTMTLWHAKHWLFTNLTNFARLGSALARHRAGLAGLDLVGRNRGHTANVHAAHKEFKIYFLIPSKYVIAGYYIQQYTRHRLHELKIFLHFPLAALPASPVWACQHKRNQNESERHKLENNWCPRCFWRPKSKVTRNQSSLSYTTLPASSH